MSECTTCAHYGPHMDGPAEDMPFPCIVCECGERYVEMGQKEPRKRPCDYCAQLEAENKLLRARIGER